MIQLWVRQIRQFSNTDSNLSFLATFRSNLDLHQANTILNKSASSRVQNCICLMKIQINSNRCQTQITSTGSNEMMHSLQASSSVLTYTASFPGFTLVLILRPIRKYTAFSALSDWSEYERTGKAWERG